MAGKAFIADIRNRLESESRSFAVKGTFLVHDKQVPLNKNGNPYLALVLKDRDGTVNAKMWDNVEETESKQPFGAGDFILVECEAQTYRGHPQLKIKKLSKVTPPGGDELADYLGTSTRSAQKMLGETRELLDSLAHSGLRGLLLARLDDPVFAENLARSPAAKTHHHACLGGLLEHTLSVMKLADALAGLYAQLDRDLLLAGAFLHDLGKMRELRTETAFAYTDEGNLVGHLVIGAEMFTGWSEKRPDIDDDSKLKLVHMILSHHGKKEFGSPVVPKFPEALALHFLDNMDSKLQSMFEVAAKESGQRWSSYQQQFESYLFLANPPRQMQKKTDELTHRPMADLQRRQDDPEPAGDEAGGDGQQHGPK